MCARACVVCVRARVCVCTCVRAFMRAHVRACAYMRACVRACASMLLLVSSPLIPFTGLSLPSRFHPTPFSLQRGERQENRRGERRRQRRLLAVPSMTEWVGGKKEDTRTPSGNSLTWVRLLPTRVTRRTWTPRRSSLPRSYSSLKSFPPNTATRSRSASTTSSITRAGSSPNGSHLISTTTRVWMHNQNCHIDRNFSINLQLFNFVWAIESKVVVAEGKQKCLF